MREAHAHLRKRRSYKKAMQRALQEGKETPKVLPEYPTGSSMEMETLMKRPEVKLEDTKDVDKWKAEV